MTPLEKAKDELKRIRKSRQRWIDNPHVYGDHKIDPKMIIVLVTAIEVAIETLNLQEVNTRNASVLCVKCQGVSECGECIDTNEVNYKALTQITTILCDKDGV